MNHSLQICYMIQSRMRWIGNLTHIRDEKYSDTTLNMVGQVAQSVLQLAMGCTVRGIESRWGQNLPHLSRLALGPTQPPVQ